MVIRNLTKSEINWMGSMRKRGRSLADTELDVKRLRRQSKKRLAKVKKHFPSLIMPK